MANFNPQKFLLEICQPSHIEHFSCICCHLGISVLCVTPGTLLSPFYPIFSWFLLHAEA